MVVGAAEEETGLNRGQLSASHKMTFTQFGYLITYAVGVCTPFSIPRLVQGSRRYESYPACTLIGLRRSGASAKRSL